MGVLEELEAAVTGVRESVSSSVVAISGGRGTGSGFVLTNGIVVTNAHNLRGGRDATVVFADGRRATGSVMGADPDADLAAIAAETEDASALALGDGNGVREGSPVFAAANPWGRGVRVTFGLVSATNQAFRGPMGRRIRGSIEHTAPLSRGSSGGPLLDPEGRVIGVNTNRLAEGFYLAIPADPTFRDRVDALARGESTQRPRLGIGVAPPWMARRLRRAVGLPDRDGLLVSAVEDDTPAAAAGLRRGDLIVGAGDRRVQAVDDLYEALDAATEGTPISLRIVRGVEEETVSVGSEGGSSSS